MAGFTECRCGRATRNHAYVCDHCMDALAKDLNEMTWLEDQLEVSITRQRGAGTASGSRSAEHGLPWHEKASQARRLLHGTLAGWVRFAHEEDIRHSSPTDDWPRDTLSSMARWLLWRLDGLALHELGHDAIDQITDAAAEARRIVLWKRKAQVYLGPCRLAPVCPGDVYAEEGAPLGYCRECEVEHDVVSRRADLEHQLDDRLCTAAEIARLTVYLGLDVERDRVRRRVLYWARHSRITQSGTSDDGDPRFRYGEVKALLYREFRAGA